MSNSISKDFKFFSLLKFAFPTMVMMVFMSLYTIVDGVFISRLVGTNALSAANIVYPALSLVIAVGVMLATGGSAVIAKKLGENKKQEARENFTFILLTGLMLGIAFMVLGNVFLDPLIRLLGATDLLMQDCRDYLGVLLYMAPACMLQMLFQSFFVTAGKPHLGLVLTVSGGIANMVLDYIFMGPMNMGIAGAAWATGIGQLIPTVFGLIYFLSVRKFLYIVKPRLQWKVLAETCLNGSSEMVTNLSTAIVTFLFNIMMLKFLGEPGVAALTIVLYGQFLFNAMYMGFSMGVAPVISFNYGRKNHVLLQRIFKICIGFICVSSVLVTALALTAAPVVVGVFTKEALTREIALRGFLLFSINYLFAGINIYASSMFTAFSDGKISAAISFVRTFVFIVLNIGLLPYLLGGVDGLWLAVPCAEFMTLFWVIYFFCKKGKDYHYVK